MCFRPPEADLNEHNICDECGTENPPGETTCLKCGAKLVKKTIEVKPTQPGSLPPKAPSFTLPPKTPGTTKPSTPTPSSTSSPSSDTPYPTISTKEL